MYIDSLQGGSPWSHARERRAKESGEEAPTFLGLAARVRARRARLCSNVSLLAGWYIDNNSPLKCVAGSYDAFLSIFNSADRL